MIRTKDSEKVFFYWLPLIAWAGLIFTLSSIPNLKTSPNPFWDQILRSFSHLIAYFLFLLLWVRCSFPKNYCQRLKWGLVLVLLYSLSDEIHQKFVPTRSFQLKDLLVDNFGSFLAAFSLWKLLPQAPAKLKIWAGKLALI